MLQGMRNSWLPIWGAVVASLSFLPSAADEFAIEGIQRTPSNSVVAHSSVTQAYYVLFSGSDVTGIVHAVEARIGEAGTSTLTDTGVAERAYYTTLQVPLHAPLDLDADFFNDADELRDGSDPLDGGSLPPSLFQGFVGLDLSLLNRAPPGLFEGRVAGTSFGVQNTAAPGLVEGHVAAPVFSVENTAMPDP